MTGRTTTDRQAIEVADRVLEGPHGPLPVRIYSPEAPHGPAFVWVHGGAFAAGDLDMPEAHWVSTALAERGIPVVSVDYRLAPFPEDWVVADGVAREEGVHFPVAHEEVVFAYRWALGSGLADGPWSLGGGSAGGNLAAGAVLALLHGDGPLPPFVFLAYPTLHAHQRPHRAEVEAALQGAPEERRYRPAAILGMYENYLGAGVDVTSAPIQAIPGLATAADLVGHPRTLVVNNELDDLRTSGEAYVDVLVEAGVDVDLVTEPGTFHGHLNRPEEGIAERTVEAVVEEILHTAAQ